MSKSDVRSTPITRHHFVDTIGQEHLARSRRRHGRSCGRAPTCEPLSNRCGMDSQLRTYRPGRFSLMSAVCGSARVTTRLMLCRATPRPTVSPPRGNTTRIRPNSLNAYSPRGVRSHDLLLSECDVDDAQYPWEFMKELGR